MHTGVQVNTIHTCKHTSILTSRMIFKSFSVPSLPFAVPSLTTALKKKLVVPGLTFLLTPTLMYLAPSTTSKVGAVNDRRSGEREREREREREKKKKLNLGRRCAGLALIYCLCFLLATSSVVTQKYSETSSIPF